MVWCENEAHGPGAHREKASCLWPHYVGLPGSTPEVGAPSKAE